MAHPKGSKRSEPSRRVRVRSRRLEQIDETKIAVALAIMSRRLLEQAAADDESELAQEEQA